VPEPLDDLAGELSVLRHGPAVVLPGAAAARARGDQRRRRRRTGLVAAGLVLAVGALPVAATLREPGVERLGVPAAAPAPSLEDGLLAPQDLAAVQAGTWEPDPSGGTPVLPAGCDATAPTGGPDAALRASAGPRRAVVRQHLVRYATGEQAAAAFTALRDALADCGDGARTTRVLEGVPGTSDTRFYAERVGATGSVPFAVERVGPVVGAVLVGAQRVSGPVADVTALPALADAAAGALARAQRERDQD